MNNPLSTRQETEQEETVQREEEKERKIVPLPYSSTKRSSIEICMELLSCLADSESTIKSKLFYKAKISYRLGDAHLDVLLEQGLVFVDALYPRRRIYHITPSGLKALELYRDLVHLQRN